MDPSESRCVEETFILFEDNSWLCVDKRTDAVINGVVTEDMQQWDCATMGNRVCGTVLPDTSTPPPSLDLGFVGVALILIGAVLVGRKKNDN